MGHTVHTQVGEHVDGTHVREERLEDKRIAECKPHQRSTSKTGRREVHARACARALVVHVAMNKDGARVDSSEGDEGWYGKIKTRSRAVLRVRQSAHRSCRAHN